VDVRPAELAALLELQQKLAALLQQTLALETETRRAAADIDTSGLRDTLRSVAKDLTALAIDLEHTDAPPTAPQRDLLEHELVRLGQAEQDWSALSAQD
jgi:hypothetical protein